MKRILGILVHHVHNPDRYFPLVSIALEEGFDEVILFTPFDVNLAKRQIKAHVYQPSGWRYTFHPFPSITYDIGYYTEPAQIRKVKQLKEHPALPFVGYSLGNKWQIHQHLSSSPQLSPFLLPTQLAKDVPTILAMVHQHESIMIKPINGKGGRGILRLSIHPDGYILAENEHPPTLYSEQQIQPILKVLAKGERYIVQKWIDIRGKNGSVYDIRALMQKNNLGLWQLTGMGVRQGDSGKITSNLTGGGHAYPVYPFLKHQFRDRAAKLLYRNIEKIAWFIPKYLEISYQKRLAELGLDLAVDRGHHIWIIEVNIKPGKTLWKKIDDIKTDEISYKAPIQYAKYLLDRAELKRLH